MFDDITGRSISADTANPDTQMGGGFILVPGTFQITGFELAAGNVTGTTFTGVRYTLSVWSTLSTGAVNAGSPAFSGLLGTFTGTDIATLNNGTELLLPITLASPLTISSTTMGIAVSFEGTTDGVNFNSINGLTPVLTSGSLPAVGTLEFNLLPKR